MKRTFCLSACLSVSLTFSFTHFVCLSLCLFISVFIQTQRGLAYQIEWLQSLYDALF